MVSVLVSVADSYASKTLAAHAVGMEAKVGIEPTDEAFAEPCLTTWLPRRERAHTLDFFYASRKFQLRLFQSVIGGKPQFVPVFPQFGGLENSGRRDDAGNEFGGRHVETGVARAAGRVGHSNILRVCRRGVTPHAPSTSLSLRSSIGMSQPRFRFQSIVDSGMAT